VLVSPRTSRRLAIAALCLASLIVCCGLAWWQWERFASASGTFQNLGYVLQWPLFGLFPAFMFWRIRQLRHKADEDGTAEAETPEEVKPAPPRRIERAVAPPVEDDDELAAYNRYLAELNTRDQQSS
jgi:DNA-binding transcriptional regulator of glucitol operon